MDKWEFRRIHGFSSSQEECGACQRPRSVHTVWNTDPEFDHEHDFMPTGVKYSNQTPKEVMESVVDLTIIEQRPKEKSK